MLHKYRTVVTGHFVNGTLQYKYFTPCPKISGTPVSNTPNSVCSSLIQRNIAHCTILTLLTVTPIMTYALYRVCSV